MSGKFPYVGNYYNPGFWLVHVGWPCYCRQPSALIAEHKQYCSSDCDYALTSVRTITLFPNEGVHLASLVGDMARQTLVKAATVVCLRHNAHGSPSYLDLNRLGIPPSWWMGRLPPKIPISGKWEVLMGQSECVNWLRSTPGKEAVMRYAGEFKFAGGTCDEGESLQATAIRELLEEFALEPSLHPSEIKLHPFNVKTTKVIKGRSYLMHNFVALASENKWLAHEHLVEASNERLRSRRERFRKQMSTGEFFQASPKQRESIAPEVVRAPFARHAPLIVDMIS